MYGNNLLFTWWKVPPKDNVHSKNRHLCYWRNAIGEAIVSLIQNQQNGEYLEDNAISLLSQGIGIPDLFSYMVSPCSSSKTRLTAACSYTNDDSCPQMKCSKWSLPRGWWIYDVFVFMPKIKKWPLLLHFQLLVKRLLYHCFVMCYVYICFVLFGAKLYDCIMH